jgi:hypothetical protein
MPFCLLIVAWALFVKHSVTNVPNIVSLACYVAGVLGGVFASRAVKSFTSLTLSIAAACAVLFSFYAALPLISWDYFTRVPAAILVNGKAISADVYRRRDEVLIMSSVGPDWYLVHGGPPPCQVMRVADSVARLGSLAVPKSSDGAYGICSEDTKIDGVPPRLVRGKDSLSFWGAAHKYVRVDFK